MNTIVDWYDTESGSTTLIEGFAVTVLAAEEPGGAILWWTVTVRATEQAAARGFTWTSSADTLQAAKDAGLLAVRCATTTAGVA